MAPNLALEYLAYARLVADYAERHGVPRTATEHRTASNHLGAALADAVLQAGVSYRTVVQFRVERIRSTFPEASVMSGVQRVVEREGISQFLLWTHATKVDRFAALIRFLAAHGVESTVDLREWLCWRSARQELLSLPGVGPKTHDYLCCLVGIDCIAVDRHIRTFVTEAGVGATDYDSVKSAVSFAADLLGVTRRDFDAWIWRTVSSRTAARSRQYALL